MFSKKSLAATLLTIALLIAPASMAAPTTGGSGFGWFDSFTSWVYDVLELFTLDKPQKTDKSPSLDGEPVFTLKCDPNEPPGETGTFPDPNGCP